MAPSTRSLSASHLLIRCTRLLVGLVLAGASSACSLDNDGGAVTKPPRDEGLVWERQPLELARKRFGEPIHPVDDPEVIGWFCNGYLLTARVDDRELLTSVGQVFLPSDMWDLYENDCAR